MKRRSRRRGKAWWDPVFLGLMLIPFSLLCMVLSCLSTYVRWVLLIGGAVDLFAAATFFILITLLYDTENTLFGAENAPRTFISSIVLILGFLQLGLYIVMSFLDARWGWG